MIFSPPHLEDGVRWAGMRVGLLGGSFDPPHEGHIHASLVALNTLVLDAIWWLVSPQNPLKNKTRLDFGQRYSLCQKLVRKYPRLIVSDIENVLGTNQTWSTIRGLRTHFPNTGFVWVTGMDNALTMHKWHNWTDILDQVATAHIARPPAWSVIENCPLKLMGTQNHVFLDKARKVPLRPRHTYWILQKKLMGISSTELRINNEKTSG